MEQNPFAPIHQDAEGKLYFNKELIACMTNNTQNEQVITILRDPNILNAFDSSGNTLLHIAAQYRNDVITRHLIHSGFEIDIQNSLGKTPLIIAIENCRFTSTCILLEADANTLIFDNAGKSALHYYLDAGWFRDLYVVWLFLKSVESQCHDNNEVIAMKLMDAGWPVACVSLLNNTEVIKIMLQRGCQVDAPDPGVYLTALHKAAFSSNIELVKLLLDYGADPNAMDKFHLAPLYYVYEKKPTHTDERLEIVKLLIAKGALTVTSTGESSKSQVDLALRFGNVEVIQILLEANLDLTRKHDNNDTPVHILAINSNTDAFKALSNKNFEIEARNGYLETPLWTAATCGNACAVEFLLKRGADANAANVDGCLPLYKCILPCTPEMASKYKECVQLLLEYGADVQREFSNYEEPPTTVFYVVRRCQTYDVGELLIAHLILQEALGTPIDEIISNQIQSHSTFEDYYDFCKQKLTVKFFKSVNLLDLLGAIDIKFENYARDQQCASSIETFNKKWKSKLYYYNTILRKRHSKAIYMLELRKEAAIHIGKIMKTDYFQFPLIADQIVNYLDKTDLRNLLQVSL